MKELVVDLGMHVGTDTDYYLARGYRVVAVEPNPQLVAAAQHKFAAAIRDGDLIIVCAALSECDGTSPFYLSSNDEFSSLEKWRVEHSGTATEIEVHTITLATLLKSYARPVYIKCDIEGADALFCQQLATIPSLPRYVSVEGIASEWLKLLAAAGYNKFQLVNQAWVRRMRPIVNFERDGHACAWTFEGASSGPFGDDLPGKWVDLQTALDLYECFERLKTFDANFTLDNWFDFHALREG